MIIPIASDHAGFKAKKTIKNFLEELGHIPVDYGTHSKKSVDYPEFAVHVAKDIDKGDHTFGILICGTGQGMCMMANKFKNVRGVVVYNKKSAELSRRHNDANLLCLPGRELKEDELKEFVEIWLETEFDGGRHERRVNKIHSLTENQD